jgi:hypothetical protein
MVLRPGAGDALFEIAKGEFGLLERLELPAQIVKLPRQRLRWDTMLAREVLDRGDPPFDEFLACRIGVQRLEIGAKRTARFAKTDDRLFEHPQWLAESRIESRCTAKHGHRARGQRMRIGAVAIEGQRNRIARCLRKATVIREARALIEQSRDFVSGEIERFELAHLVAQELDARDAVTGQVRQSPAFIGQAPPFEPKRAHRI